MQFTKILMASFAVVLQLAAAAPVADKEVLIFHEVAGDAPAPVVARNPEAVAEPEPYLICNNC